MLTCFTVNKDNCSVQHYLAVQESLLIRFVQCIQGVRSGLILGQLGPEVLQDHPPVLVGLEIPVIQLVHLVRKNHAVL